MWLDRTAVRRLTKKVKFKAQCRELDKLGYRYTLAADGEPLVPQTLDRGKRAKGPRWELMA